MLKSLLRCFLLYQFIFHVGYAQTNQATIDWQFDSPQFMSFEGKSQKHINRKSGGKLQTVSISRIGNKGIEWTYQKGDELIIDVEGSIEHQGGAYPKGSAFSAWLYGTGNTNGQFEVSFWANNEKQSYYTIELGFKGWRTTWFNYVNMSNPDIKHFSQIKIKSLKDDGDIVIDALIPTTLIEYRYPYPDFVTPDNPNGHERGLFANIELLKHKLSDNTSVEVKEIEDLETIERTVRGTIKKNHDQNRLDKAKKIVEEELLIRELDGRIEGKTIYINPHDINGSVANGILSDEHAIPLAKVQKHMFAIADMWRKESSASVKEELANAYIKINRLLIEQGWVCGHAHGSMHHAGYSTRQMAEAQFIMKDVLQSAGMLKEVQEYMMFVFNFFKIFDQPIDCSMDYLNTVSKSHLFSCLLVPDQEERVKYMRAYTKYLNGIIELNTNDIRNGFKVDGTSFHHGMNYPAYAVGALNQVSFLFKLFSSTQFRLSEAAYLNVQNALRSTQLFLGINTGTYASCGRHPLGLAAKKFKPALVNMALAGTADNSSAIDEEMAQLALRAGASDKALSNHSPLKEISGNWSYNFAGMNVHRRSQWMVCTKGYNKWVDATEIYKKDNRWGRYLANGSVQVLVDGYNAKENGFDQDGWDWNRIPGATIVYHPLKELEAPIDYIQQRSAEIMATSVSLNDNGVFGFVLDEDGSFLNGECNTIFYDKNGQPKVWGDGLKAKKSIFAFSNTILCLGSNIEANKEENVETVLFQNSMSDKSMAIEVNDVSISTFPFNSQHDKGTFIKDAIGHGYYVAKSGSIGLERKEQQSYYNKTRKGYLETKGIFSSAWLKGCNDYAYLIIPECGTITKAEAKKLYEQFEVIQHDAQSHIVMHKYDDKSSIGMVCFDKWQGKCDCIEQVSAQAVICLQKTQGAINLAVTNPLLNNDMVDNHQQLNLTITLDEVYPVETVTGGEVHIIDGQTVLKVTALAGQAMEVKLSN